MMRVSATFVLAAFPTSLLLAEGPVTSAVAVDASATLQPNVTLPAGSAVTLTIDDELSSKRSAQGDHFTFHVATDVVDGDRVVIPKGAPGYGEVIHADNAGMGGKPGELILAARAIEVDGRTIELRRFRFGAPEDLPGKDRSSTATTMGIAGVVVPGLAIGSLFVKGGEFIVPAGTLAHALTKSAITFELDDGSDSAYAAPPAPDDM